MSRRKTTDTWCFTLHDVSEGDYRQLVFYITGCQWGRPQTASISHYRMSTLEISDRWCFTLQDVMSRRKTTYNWWFTLEDVNHGGHIQLVFYIKGCQWGRPQCFTLQNVRKTINSWCFTLQDVCEEDHKLFTAGVLHYRMSMRKTTDYKQLVFYITGCQWGRPQTAILHYRMSMGETTDSWFLHYRMPMRDTTDSWCFALPDVILRRKTTENWCFTSQDISEGGHRQLVLNYIAGCQW